MDIFIQKKFTVYVFGMNFIRKVRTRWIWYSLLSRGIFILRSNCKILPKSTSMNFTNIFGASIFLSFDLTFQFDTDDVYPYKHK